MTRQCRQLWKPGILVVVVLGILLLGGIAACSDSAAGAQSEPAVSGRVAPPDSALSQDEDPLVGTYQLRSVDPQGQEVVGVATVETSRLTVDADGFTFYLTYLVGVTFPLLVGAVLINWFLVNLLLGIREYYADHRATRYANISDLAMGLKRLRELSTFEAGRRHPTRLAPVGHLALLPIHPSPAHRWRAMHAPAVVFTAPWKLGITVWVVIVMFYSLSATLLASVSARQPDTLIPVALAFVLLATALTPHLVLAHDRRVFRNGLLSAVLVYSILLLAGQSIVAVSLVGMISALPDSLDYAVNLVNTLQPEVQLDEQLTDPLRFLDLAVVRPLLFTLVATPTLMVLALTADTWLKRIVLRCYAAPWSVHQRNWLLLGCTLVVALVLQNLVVPLISWPFFPDVLTYREAQAGLLAGLALLATSIWGGLLWFWWRRYGNHCPRRPDHRVPGAYGSTDVCPVCGMPLLPWLTESADARESSQADSSA
jgi:hypothetical protein